MKWLTLKPPGVTFDKLIDMAGYSSEADFVKDFDWVDEVVYAEAVKRNLIPPMDN